MMKNINTLNKKFLDAIRFKTTLELKEFKKKHNDTIKKLASSQRAKKKEDLTLKGATTIFKEAPQN